jgi:hypothetical protein
MDGSERRRGAHLNAPAAPSAAETPARRRRVAAIERQLQARGHAAGNGRVRLTVLQRLFESFLEETA